PSFPEFESRAAPPARAVFVWRYRVPVLWPLHPAPVSCRSAADRRCVMFARFAAAVAAMVAVVAASNILVQFPVRAQFGPLDLADLLTWGAFTYPVAFLVTDLTNRHFGPRRARLVVVAGFAVAVILSIWLATPRIAIASGSAFLVAQLLDISIFHRLRDAAWWKAP